MMKRLLLLPLCLFLFAACNDPSETRLSGEVLDREEADGAVLVDGESFVAFGEPLPVGEGITELSPVALTEDLGTYQGTVARVRGEVAKMCQMNGCWLTLRNDGGMPIRIEVPRDSSGAYVYTFPTDLGSGEVIVEGMVRGDSTDVETLRHFAEDEGQSQAEIDAITEPRQTVILTARGALVRRVPDTPEASPVTEPEGSAAQS